MLYFFVAKLPKHHGTVDSPLSLCNKMWVELVKVVPTLLLKKSMVNTVGFFYTHLVRKYAMAAVTRAEIT